MSERSVDVHQELIERVPVSLNGQAPRSAGPDRPAPVADPPPATAPPARPWYRRRWAVGAGVVLGLVVLGIGAVYLHHAMTHESTDDAFIQAHVVAVAPKVANYVSRVYIDDNSHVKRGDLLVELDPRDFETRVAQARANLAAAVAEHQAATTNVRVVATTSSAGVSQAEAGVQTTQRQADAARSRLEQAHAQAQAAEAEATRAAADVVRYEDLLQSGAVSRQERDNAVAANRTAAANLDAAGKAEQAAADGFRQTQAQVAQAQAQLASAKAAPDQIALSRAQAAQAAARISQLEAALRQAELDLSYTKIHASETGRVTRKSVEPGNYVQVNQVLFSIVPDQVWVVANFKETQLRDMRPGQPVTIRVDAYPDRRFRGHVDSIQAGSGAAFSLLPPENATGNYVKVVQRVPVKILIDEPPDPAHVLGPGMSVVPDVRVR
ncbi:MAG TPA: HlyD family secretion protein [Methylomirabilota bacterium]